MKIRIKGNSVRCRLSKTDIKSLAMTGCIEESTQFANGKLTYRLKKATESKLMATFIDNAITLLMPEAMVAEWAATDRVGFEGYHGELFLLVEKDFQCLDNVAEDQSDNYPNPNCC